MRALVILIALSIAGPFGCQLFKPEEPKQREDWISSPMRYGNTQYEGLRSPGWDAGTD